MCGIAGIFGAAAAARDDLVRRLGRMNAAQAHRGPDDSGFMVFPECGSGLAACRLSIVDIEGGHQPVSSEDGSVHVVFNGEIYNHAALRERLAGRGHRFRSRCDTEVIAHLYEEHGVQLLEHLRGMYALAVFDAANRRLLLARDGPGMKPLHWALTPAGLVFASEVRALFASGLVSPEPSPEAIDAYLVRGYIPAPLCAFRGVSRLPAGGFLTAGAGGVRTGSHWGFRYPPPAGAVSDAEYAEELGQLLEEAVASHMAADVPVGAFLSGGWDSSLVTTLAARRAGGRLKTFSIVFPEDPAIDESRFSRLVAARLGTEHSEIEFRTADFPEVLPRAARQLEEPCSSNPAALIFHLSSLAARHVKTVLAGEGSDELFGGYPWNRSATPYRLRRIAPRALCRAAAALCAEPRLRTGLRFLGAPDEPMADAERSRAFLPAEKRALLIDELHADGPDVACFLLPEEILATCRDRTQRRLALDFCGRLSDGILWATDKVSMAHSLEVRLPFLDRSLVDFAARLPSRLKIAGGREKVILAPLARKLLPPEIAARRKLGLQYPRNCWSAPPLAGYVRSLLLDHSGGPFRRPALERELRGWMRPGWTQERKIVRVVFLQFWWDAFFR